MKILQAKIAEHKKEVKHYVKLNPIGPSLWLSIKVLNLHAQIILSM